MRPEFTIVIPTYNRATHLAAAVRSVLNQDFKNFELIIVDDGSTDETEAVIRAIPDPRLIYLKKSNEERGAARNYGARAATGMYINFLDSDDLLYPIHLSTASAFINAHHSPPVFHLGYDMKDDKGSIIKQKNNINNINERILSGNLLSCNGVFLQKEVALKFPFIENRNLASLEDWELWIRLAAFYTILGSNTITSTIVNHTTRSVVSGSEKQIIQKVKLFIDTVLANQDNQNKFKNKLRATTASAKTYAALHLSMIRTSRTQTLLWLMQGVMENPMELFKKRFFVVLKNLATL